MTSSSLTIDTPAGPVRATAGPRQADAVVFELGGAMRGSVHVTGTTDPHHRDQFTAVRACLGPVNAYTTTAPAEDLPRLARSRTGYRGSLTLYRYADGPAQSLSPMTSALITHRRRRRPRYSPPSCAPAQSTSRSAPTCPRSSRPPAWLCRLLRESFVGDVGSHPGRCRLDQCQCLLMSLSTLTYRHARYLRRCVLSQ
ncbi:hypothetical protein [Streptomyces sp. NPDC051001]|uniref:hypothetical protein n=1 Tax=Streptomyces sp. NPDC051001 TaxID=3155795 RepID=UPI00342A61BC